MSAIPIETAILICSEIRQERGKKIYSAGELQCKACMESSNGDPGKMCFTSQLDNRGCIYINQKFDKGKY
jgi:hypothetical protein